MLIRKQPPCCIPYFGTHIRCWLLLQTTLCLILLTQLRWYTQEEQRTHSTTLYTVQTVRDLYIRRRNFRIFRN